MNCDIHVKCSHQEHNQHSNPLLAEVQWMADYSPHLDFSISLEKAKDSRAQTPNNSLTGEDE